MRTLGIRSSGGCGFAAAIAVSVVIAAPPAIAADDEIREIIVTTRKIEENVRDIPIAITAFGAQELEDAGIDALDDIADLTPGFSYFSAFGGFLPTPVIRGVAQTDIFGEPNVAIFLDGVYVSGREAQNFSQLDLERVEIVKGPQSTLYGRNAFSGLVNYVMKKPTAEFSAGTEVTAGNEGKVLGKGYISGPVFTDELRGRFAAMYDEWDGSYDNAIAGGPDVGGYTYRSMRGVLEWQPADTFTARLSGYYSDDEIDNAAIVGQQANCEDDIRTGDTDQRLLNYCGELQDLGAQYRSLGVGLGDTDVAHILPAVGEKREVTQGSLVVDWETGVGTISSLTGYFRTNFEAFVDGGFGLGYNVPFVYAYGDGCELFDVESGLYACATPTGPDNGGRILTGQLEYDRPTITEEVSQELRFTSPVDRPFRYSFGTYLYRTTFDDAETSVTHLGGPALTDDQRLGFFAPVSPTRVLTIGDAIFREWFGPNGDDDPRQTEFLETEALSLFGHIEFDFLDKFTARLEARFTDETKELRRISFGAPESPNADDVLDERQEKESWDLWTGRAQVKYEVNDDWQTYLTVGRGIKSGGFDNDTVDILDDPETPVTDPIPGAIVIVPFDEEVITAFEWGIKGVSATGAFELDLAIYRYNWDDVVVPQVFDFDPIRGPGYEFEQPEAFNDNAGDASVQGWELGLNFYPIESFVAKLGVSYTDATWDNGRIESFANFPSFYTDDFDDTNDGDITGKQLLRQPPWQVSASLAHELPVFESWTYFSRLDVSWQDDWYVGNENQTIVPDRTNVNFRLGMKSDQYSVELWARNLLDDEKPVGAYRQPYFTNTDELSGDSLRSTQYSIFPWAIMTSHPDRRTFGLTLKARFGGE